MKPTVCSPGHILIPRQTLLDDDPRFTAVEKQALLANVGITQSGVDQPGRKNQSLIWSVCRSSNGWYGQSSEDKETIRTDLYDARGYRRGLAQAEWISGKEVSYIHFCRRYKLHLPKAQSESDVSAIDSQTGETIKTMPRATSIRPSVKHAAHRASVWDYNQFQTMLDLMKWLSQNYPLWKDPFAYWD